MACQDGWWLLLHTFVCWSNGIGGSIQNILLNRSTLAGKRIDACCHVDDGLYSRTAVRSPDRHPIGDKTGRKEYSSVWSHSLLFQCSWRFFSPNVYVLYFFGANSGSGNQALIWLFCLRFYGIRTGKKPRNMVEPYFHLSETRHPCLQRHSASDRRYRRRLCS